MPADETPPKLPAHDVAVDETAASRPPKRRPLTPAAERALAEAAARRAERDRKPADRPPELHGRGGLDPTRYGDWEIDGLTSDF